jgi:ADP-ribose pyrophosphatase YjhB (NUDIX family)
MKFIMPKTKWIYCPQCKEELVPGDEGCPSCPAGHFTKYPTPVATATAFIRHNGKFLTVKRNIEPHKGAWNIPGGFLMPGETAFEGLKREAREETGLEVERIEYIGSFPSIYGDTGVATIAVSYLVESSTDKVVLSDESQEYMWCDIEEIPEPSFEDDRRGLQALRDKLGKN